MAPALQEFRHSLLRDGSRLHNVFLTLSRSKSFCTRKPLRKILNSDDHFERPFSFRPMREITSTTITTKNMKTLSVINSIHRSLFRRALLLITTALVVIAVLTAAPVRATPACGFNAQILAMGTFPDGLLDLMCNESQQYGWDLKTKVKGDSDVYVLQNTWPVGAHTGWHTHPGPSLIIVVQGTLTEYMADDRTCTTEIHTAGTPSAVFTDIGCGMIHLVRNEGTVCAVAYAVQIIPAGQPRRVDAAQPASCPTFTCASPTPCPP